MNVEKVMASGRKMYSFSVVKVKDVKGGIVLISLSLFVLIRDAYVSVIGEDLATDHFLCTSHNVR